MYDWLKDQGKVDSMLSLSTVIGISEKLFVKRYVELHPRGSEVWQELKKKFGSENKLWRLTCPFVISASGGEDVKNFDSVSSAGWKPVDNLYAEDNFALIGQQKMEHLKQGRFITTKS